jgi:hypothetical protein
MLNLNALYFFFFFFRNEKNLLFLIIKINFFLIKNLSEKIIQ